jgi:ABC-2 type transport system permease protein
MMRLAFTHFIRSGGIRMGVVFLLIIGLTALLVGKQFSRRQQQTIQEVMDCQQQDFPRNAALHHDDLGLLLYYLPFSLINQPPPLAALSIGQRDVNASVQRVTIRALEGQKYDADLTNPAHLVLGNVDFSFVLIYLFPLLIIAFTYSIISGEKEQGTWRMVAIQRQHLFWFVCQLFSIRLAVIGAVLLVIGGLAVPVLGIPLDGLFGLFMATSVLYVLFWFSVCFWVASLQRSSSTNAMLLLGIWLALLIVIPAAVNNYLLARYPAPEAQATTLAQRKGYHEKWDLDKTATLEKFYAHYPQFRQVAVVEMPFDWRWYYAMQQLGDDESAGPASELRHKLRQREIAGRTIAQFIPTLHTQLQLGELARSGLGNQLRFLDYTSRFHEKMRLYFYPKIFSNAPVSAERWRDFRVETFADTTPVSPVAVLGPLLVCMGLFTGAGWYRFRRTIYHV